MLNVEGTIRIEQQNLARLFYFDLKAIMQYGAINIDPTTDDSKPVFNGTDVTVQTLFEYLEDGKSLEKFLNDYPAVNLKDAVEVLQMAKLAVTTEKILRENF